MFNRLEALKQRKDDFRSKSELLVAELRGNPQFANEVKELAWYFLGKTPTGCSSCLADFFIELVYLNTDGMNKADRQFILNWGAIFRMNENIYSNKNINDDISIEHLSEYPDDIKLFRIYPDNWEELIEAKKAESLVARQTTLQTQIEGFIPVND